MISQSGLIDVCKHKSGVKCVFIHVATVYTFHVHIIKNKYNESFLLEDSHVILESPMCASTLDSIYYAAMFLEEYRFQYISALEEPRQIQWNRRADAESLEAVPTDCPL